MSCRVGLTVVYILEFQNPIYSKNKAMGSCFYGSRFSQNTIIDACSMAVPNMYQTHHLSES